MITRIWSVLVSIIFARELYAQTKGEIEQNKSLEVSEFKKTISFAGLIEFDIIQSKALDQGITSQIDLATLELATDIAVSNSLKGSILLEKQGPPESLIDVTEAYLTYENSDMSPFTFQIGKIVIPFGKFETRFFSDPLGLSMAETHKNVALVGLKWQGVEISVYVFKGETKEEGKDDRLRQYGAQLGYSLKNDDWGLNLNADYISNFADTDTLAETVSNFTLNKEVPAYALSVSVQYKQLSLTAEYITANHKFDSADLTYDNDGAKPFTLQLESSYTFVWSYETTFVIGYQSSKESIGLELPKSRTLVGFDTKINEYASVGLEHFLDEDYAISDCAGSTCGSGNKGNTTTLRFALNF